MNSSITRKIPFLALLALGPVLIAGAQTAPDATAPAAPPPATPAVAGPAAPAAPDTGLLGQTYVQGDFGYQRNDIGAPEVLHDYGAVYNQSLFKRGDWGTDLGLNYDYLTGSARGFHDRIDVATAGLTEYLAQPWGDPFVTADAGGAWQRDANVSRKSFDYSFTSGVQFPIVPNLFLTPFVAYQAAPCLYNHESPNFYYPNHDWTYGARLTYRLTSGCSLSFTMDQDQYSRDDLGYKAGLTIGF